MKKNVSYKKSILLSIGFLFLGGCLAAQDLPRIKELLHQRKLAEAKEAVDSLMTFEQPAAATFLIKAEVYSAVGNDIAFRKLAPDARWEAFQSLQKAVLADKEYTNHQVTGDSCRLVFDLYNGYTTEGMQYYNAGAERDDKASFATALTHFKKAAAVSQFIYSNKWGKTEIDTLNILYLSKSSINADKEEDAVFYSKKIADNNLQYPPFKSHYEIIYQWLVYYYKERKELESFIKYLALAKEQFPLSAYFDLAEIDWLREQREYALLFTKYKQLLQAEPASNVYRLSYYRDQFMYLWGPGGSNQPNKLVPVKALVNGLQQLAAGNNQNGVAMNARLLLAKVYINQAQDLSKELLMRSTTDPKVTGSYKKRYRDLLLLSNRYLKQITAVKTMQLQATGREAAQLLTVNLVALKAK